MLIITAAGRIGKDAEIRRTQGGDNVLSFSLAVDQRKGQEKSTVWVECSIFGARASENVAQHLRKGTSLTVTGTLNVRQWEGNGKSGVSVQCRVSEFTFQGGGDRGEDRSATPRGGGKPPVDDLDGDEIPFD